MSDKVTCQRCGRLVVTVRGRLRHHKNGVDWCREPTHPLPEQLPRMVACPGCGQTETLRLLNTSYITFAVACADVGDAIGCDWRGPRIASDETALAKTGAIEEWNRRSSVPGAVPTPSEPPAGSTQTELEIAQRAQRLIADVAVTEIAKARDLLGRFMVWASGVAVKSLYGEQVVADADAFLAPDGSTQGVPEARRFMLKLTCCGREADPPPSRPMTWAEADAFRESYVSGPGVTSPERPRENGHVRSAIIVEASDVSVLETAAIAGVPEGKPAGEP